MNVYKYELKAARYRTLMWIVVIMCLVAMYFSIYPAFSKDADTIKNLFNNMPAAVHHILGVGSDLKQFSFLGFVGNIFPFITLIGAIQASTLGLGILSKEKALSMSDFILTKPKTRRSIFWQKVLAGATTLIVTEFIVVAGAFGIAAAVGAGDFSRHDFLMFWGSFILIQFWFYALGLLISQLVNKVKATAPLGLGLSFGFFLVAVFALIVGDDSVRWLTPFRYIDYKKIVTDGAYDMWHVAFGLTLITIFTAACYLIYTRRDVPAAI